MTAKADVNDLVPKSPTEGLSPNARSFQRYGDIPVSLYTGTPTSAYRWRRCATAR
jgi:hypothetical protein